VNKTATVYSKAECVQCAATVRKLDQVRIAFELVDAEEAAAHRAEAAAEFESVDEYQVPVDPMDVLGCDSCQ
jgi:glutaredoxin